MRKLCSVVRAVMFPRCSWICWSALKSRFSRVAFMSWAKGGQGPNALEVGSVGPVVWGSVT